MVINREAEGMTTGEVIVEEEEGSDNGSTEKLGRGRGRPAGSLNKSNGGLSQLTAEVAALTAKVEELQAQIHATPSVDQSTFSNQLEKRLTVVQYWVETFHQFLLTSRITNSVDKVAEEELALIIQKLPDCPPINAEEG